MRVVPSALGSRGGREPVLPPVGELVVTFPKEAEHCQANPQDGKRPAVVWMVAPEAAEASAARPYNPPGK